MRNEHLRAAAKHWEDSEEEVFEMFSLSYLNGHLPPWWYAVWGSVTSVPLFKTAEQDPSVLRPVGIKSSFLCQLHRQVVKANTSALREHLEPCQVALMPSGGAVLVHTVRMAVEQRPDFVCVCLDVCNAHNEISRRVVVVEPPAPASARLRAASLSLEMTMVTSLALQQWSSPHWQSSEPTSSSTAASHCS